MNRAQVIANKLDELQENDYRNGFNDCVLGYCRDALNEFDGSGEEFWSAVCCNRMSEVLREFMDSDQALMDYFDEVSTMAKGPGAFEMPAWGTKGT